MIVKIVTTNLSVNKIRCSFTRLNFIYFDGNLLEIDNTMHIKRLS